LEDRREVEMTRRPSPLRDAFPVLVCEAPLRPRSDAWIGSRHLPTRPENPRDIVVIGDTGCRMVYWQIQPCRNGVEWPIADSAAPIVDTKGSIIGVVLVFHEISEAKPVVAAVFLNGHECYSRRGR
jgi:hypothetical protein